MIKEKWPYILVVFLLIGAGFVYIQCQPPKTNVSFGKQEIQKETPSPEASTTDQQKKTIEVPKVDDIVIDLKGAIKKPGVYHMTPGDRVIDVVEKAGGLTDKADKKKVNLAKKLTDEMLIYIPAIGENVPNNGDLSLSNGNPDEGSSGVGKININTATEQELEQIPGIGPSKAAAILEFRQKNGSFQTIDDLDKVPGFGAKTLDRMKDQIIVQ